MTPEQMLIDSDKLICPDCGDGVAKRGRCDDCNEQFWLDLMTEEADRFRDEDLLPARG